MFQAITPPLHQSSFRLRLRTAFTPSSNTRYASSSSSTSTTSPLSRRESDEFSPDSFFSSCSSQRNSSTFSASSRIRALLVRHHKPSVTDLRLQEEKRTFGPELRMLEPRPQNGMVMGGIFEVLEGSA
ncbi:hypothetical protein E2P81_ATG05037 [Venturia nashicola]|uniref:Uncharacterized protein n=1 Tax=Venturia nashicola TaxID=86259 RepID=A0A4Z1PIV5_9PEZI|nr:hypothetical protein E6O75_ATG05164 [Venturia nashicola]TLD34872.1 hypothetical protein E2P81_ATG05037 [Venturia nashicola]